MHDVTIRQLRAFVAVARSESFAQGASSLHLTQPALSSAIQKLEQLLEIRLFDRTTRSVGLTDLGADFLPQAERLLAELEATVASVRMRGASKRGRVSLASIESLAASLLPELMRLIREELPDVQLVVYDMMATNVVASVESGANEIGLTSTPDRKSAVISQHLFEDPFYVLCREDHPLTSKAVIRFADLQGIDYVMPTRRSGALLQLEQVFRDHNVEPNIVGEAAHLTVGYAYVSAGLGVTALSAMALPPHPIEGLTVRRLVDPELSRQVHMIAQRNRTLSPAAQAVWNLLAKAVGQNFYKGILANFSPVH